MNLGEELIELFIEKSIWSFNLRISWINVENQNKEKVMVLCVIYFAGSLVSLLLRLQCQSRNMVVQFKKAYL